MKPKTFIATCECEDFVYRAGREYDQRVLNKRWGDAQQLLVLQAQEIPSGGMSYRIKSPGIERSSYEVIVSYGNGDLIDWPCKHVLRAISEEMRRLHGLLVIGYIPIDVQLLTGEKVMPVDGRLQAVVQEVAIED